MAKVPLQRVGDHQGINEFGSIHGFDFSAYINGEVVVIDDW
jgi:hypothetical protein